MKPSNNCHNGSTGTVSFFELEGVGFIVSVIFYDRFKNKNITLKFFYEDGSEYRNEQ